MTRVKYILINLADKFDVYILRHRFYRVCHWIGQSEWWGDTIDLTLSQLADIIPLLILRLHETPHDHVSCIVCERDWWANETPEHAPDCPVPLLEEWKARR